MGVAEVISRRLAAGELLVIDGGTGTQLQAEGVPMDDTPGARAPTWSSPTWCSASMRNTSGPAPR